MKFTIKEKYRGFGLGKIMIEHAIQKATELKYKKIFLFTARQLTDATELYQKSGFQLIPEHKDMIDETNRCSLLMQLNIKP